jgi:hypothetical protein
VLRLAPVVLGALAACGQAGAQPSATSGVTPPAGWQPLPALAAKVGVAGAEAWGETARGCYAVWFVVRGSGATPEAILAGLSTAKLTTSNVVTPDGDGVLTATFASAPYTGRLRARIAGDTITSLACFANEREPKSCEAPCNAVLGALP